ncbi:MAG: pyridoxamine 5'-phosphate oxidase family protein [Magnetovibrio sp.]|nr:pyridoxamine 5'-phosphate oxidase family protein [Magnetovibrio sp.]
MAKISSTEELRRIYDQPKGRPLAKQIDRLEAHCRRFIELSPFLIMATSSADGFGDASPKGEAPGFVQVMDDRTLAIPDRPGNNRLDSMTNLLDNPKIGLIFLIPGVNETLRINGTAEIRDDDDLLRRFEVNGKLPKTVIVVTAREVYLHCAKALMRSRLWDADAQAPERPIPTMSEMIRDQTDLDIPLETEEDMRERYRAVLY